MKPKTIKQLKPLLALCIGATWAVAPAAHATGTQGPSAYTSGGYGRYYSPSGQYVGIDTGGSISTPHRASWQAYQNAVNRRPPLRTPCGGYLRAPEFCKTGTLSYTAYQSMQR